MNFKLLMSLIMIIDGFKTSIAEEGNKVIIFIKIKISNKQN